MGYRFKELTKIELDRHSYEVQIKELSTQAAEVKGMNNENMRLQEVIRRQTLEIEELRRKTESTGVTLQAKYEEALRRLEKMMTERPRLVEEAETFKMRLRNVET